MVILEKRTCVLDKAAIVVPPWNLGEIVISGIHLDLMWIQLQEPFCYDLKYRPGGQGATLCSAYVSRTEGELKLL